MYGRYGPDHLGVAMIVVSLVLNLLHGILRLAPLMYVAYVVLALAVFRVLSRNTVRRRRENDRFIRYWWPLRTNAGRSLMKLRHRKTHKFLRCPGCSNTLRVPRGKGKLQITCPKCGERFFKRT